MDYGIIGLRIRKRLRSLLSESMKSCNPLIPLSCPSPNGPAWICAVCRNEAKRGLFRLFTAENADGAEVFWAKRSQTRIIPIFDFGSAFAVCFASNGRNEPKRGLLRFCCLPPGRRGV